MKQENIIQKINGKEYFLVEFEANNNEQIKELKKMIENSKLGIILQKTSFKSGGFFRHNTRTFRFLVPSKNIELWKKEINNLC